MFGRAGLVPKLGPRPPENTPAVKWVTWYKIRPSDWSIQKMLQSDWLVRTPPPYTTVFRPILNHALPGIYVSA